MGVLLLCAHFICQSGVINGVFVELDPPGADLKHFSTNELTSKNTGACDLAFVLPIPASIDGVGSSRQSELFATGGQGFIKKPRAQPVDGSSLGPTAFSHTISP